MPADPGGPRSTDEPVLGPEHPYAPLAQAHRSKPVKASPDTDTSGEPTSWVERFVGGYSTDGPRVRLGLVWFVVAVLAAAAGVGAVALVFGGVAGAAATQTAAAWRRVGHRPNVAVAGLGALCFPMAAAFGIGLAGLFALLMALAAVVAGFVGSGRSDTALMRAGLTLRSGFWVGLAGAAAVLICRTDGGALVALIVLISGYEVGDYLVGTGASNPAEGPIAGIAAVLVLTFAISVFAFPPFETGSAWVFGGLAAALAPLGPFVASALVPSADARVPALRRLDSWLLVGPLWAWLLWGYLL